MSHETHSSRSRRCAAILAAVAIAIAQPATAQFTDAVSREVSVFNTVGDSAAQMDAISREVSLQNDLSPPPAELADALSREVAIANLSRSTIISSSGPAHAYPVSGTLRQQLQALSAVPPAFNIATWLPVHRRDANTADAFCSTVEPTPLARQYVNAVMYFSGADEVTYDNTGSAFYRWTFTIPCGVRRAHISGSANADDQGILWLNGQQISGSMTIPTCDPTGDPCLPNSCYTQQDTGTDRADAIGRRVLTAPTADPIGMYRSDLLFSGTGNVNELVFAIAGNAAPTDPTGVEFALLIAYEPQCSGDANNSRAVDFGDITTVLSNFGGGGPDGDSNFDCAVTFTDITAVLANFGNICQ